MQSKPLVRFLNRAARFDGDVELVDILGAAVTKGELDDTTGRRVLRHVVKSRHPRLWKQKPSAHNRALLIGHLKSTLYAAYIKDLFEDVTEYFAQVLAAAARNGISPDRLVGEHKLSIEANDILKCGGWDQVVAMVATSIFRKLETERSTKALLEAMTKKLALSVDQKVIDAALPYLEIRHLLVHADGVADSTFVHRYPQLASKTGEKIELGYQAVEAARRELQKLVKHFDQKIVSAGLLGAQDVQP